MSTGPHHVVAGSVPVTGATLYYETRGSGPALVLMGTPFGTAAFAPLAQHLAEHYTVVTYDPRGTGRSPLVGDPADDTPELRAADVAAVLGTLGHSRVEAFGSSGGAMTGLALAANEPTLVSTLVAHEPPVTALLPDAAALTAGVDDVVETFHTRGRQQAMAKFVSLTEGVEESDIADDDPEAAEEPDPDGEYFLSRMLPHTPRWWPDARTLTAGPTTIKIAVGEASDGQLAHRTSLALAAHLHLEAVVFPGDHVGTVAQPERFARRLRAVLCTA